MRWIFIITCLLNVWPTWGQTFSKRYDLRDIGRPQVAWNIEATTSSAFIIVQTSSEMDTIEPGLFFSRPAIGLTLINGSDGEKLWDKRFFPPWHGVVPGWANCCDSLSGGGVVIGGSKQDTLQNLAVFLMVFDAEGDTVFTRDMGIAGQQWNGFSVKRTQDGGFILVGQTDATGYLDGFAIRTDAQGNELWRRTYGQPAPQTDGLIAVWEMNNGDLVMGGAKYPTTTTFQRWVQRTDLVGNVLWELLWPAIDRGAGAYIEPLANGDCLMASNWSFDPNFQAQRFHLARIDMSSGTVLWDKLYADAHPFQALFAAKETPTGDLIACGVSEESGYMQGVLLRTTANGDSLWMRKYWYQDSIYTQGTGQFYDVLPTADGGFIATGPCYRYQPVPPNFPPGYSQDAWVVKVDADGCIVPGCNSVGITEQATNLLDALRIWPNPVASGQAINVQLELPPSVANLPLQLSLVGMDGRLAMQRTVPQGISSFSFHLSDLASGLYYVHVASAGKWLTGGKLIVE